MAMFLTFCNKEDDDFCNLDNALSEIGWLEEKINEAEKDSIKIQVFKVIFNEQEGFIVEECLINNDCSRALGAYYDCAGNQLCSFGGIVGNECIEYMENTTTKELLFP